MEQVNVKSSRFLPREHQRFQFMLWLSSLSSLWPLGSTDAIDTAFAVGIGGVSDIEHFPNVRFFSAEFAGELCLKQQRKRDERQNFDAKKKGSLYVGLGMLGNIFLPDFFFDFCRLATCRSWSSGSSGAWKTRAMNFLTRSAELKKAAGVLELMMWCQAMDTSKLKTPSLQLLVNFWEITDNLPSVSMSRSRSINLPTFFRVTNPNLAVSYYQIKKSWWFEAWKVLPSMVQARCRLGNNVLTLPIIIDVSYKNVWGIREWVNSWNNKINMGWFDTIFDITHEQYWWLSGLIGTRVPPSRPVDRCHLRCHLFAGVPRQYWLADRLIECKFHDF